MNIKLKYKVRFYPESRKVSVGNQNKKACPAQANKAGANPEKPYE
jgi:hypothetical protein